MKLYLFLIGYYKKYKKLIYKNKFALFVKNNKNLIQIKRIAFYLLYRMD